MEEVLNEKKHNRFRRLAESRTNKVLKMISLIENLSNRANYNYKQSEVEQMFSAIREKLDAAEKQFGDAPREKRKKFSLNENEPDEQPE